MPPNHETKTNWKSVAQYVSKIGTEDKVDEMVYKLHKSKADFNSSLNNKLKKLGTIYQK